MMASGMFAIIQLICVLIVCNDALVCYENDDNGKVYEMNNSAWNYCVMIPGSDGEARVFGVDPTADWTETYDHAFASSDNIYKVLTMCLLEKYDFGMLSTKFSGNAFTAEFMFRCVCNYDRCNGETNLTQYLNSIKSDNGGIQIQK